MQQQLYTTTMIKINNLISKPFFFISVTHIYKGTMETIRSDANSLGALHFTSERVNQAATRIEHLHRLVTTVCYQTVVTLINIHLLRVTEFTTAIRT